MQSDCEVFAYGFLCNRIARTNRHLCRLKKKTTMEKSFKIEVDCANCANLVETAVKKVEGIKDASISFMTQKMKVNFEDDADPKTVMTNVIKTAKKIEPDFVIF